MENIHRKLGHCQVQKRRDEESKVFPSRTLRKVVTEAAHSSSKKEMNCHEPVKGSEFNAVVSLCALHCIV